MKSLIPCFLTGAAALFVVAQNPNKEQAPPGSEEKIAAALPDKAYAKPEKPRKLLVFSKTSLQLRQISPATPRAISTT